MSRLAAVHSALSSCLRLLEPLHALANSCMVDFITEDLWTQLVPQPLAEQLLQLSEQQLLQLPAVDPSVYSDGAVRQFCRQLQAHRRSVADVLTAAPSVRQPLPPHMDHFMQDKKHYETVRMSSIVAHLTRQLGVSQLIDVGGGRGYLGTTLAFAYGMPVLSLEGNSHHSQGAQHFTRQIERSWDTIVKRSERIQLGIHDEKLSRKKRRQMKTVCQTRVAPSNGGNIVHHACHITSSTDMCGLVRDHCLLSDDDNNGERQANKGLALIGLHTCGDLAVHSINAFIRQPIRLLVNVACCYHFLRECGDPPTSNYAKMYSPERNMRRTDDGDDQAEERVQEQAASFPLSSHLINLGFKLGKNARGMAAQSAERISVMQRRPSPTLYYRALLQLLVRERLGHIPRHVSVGKLSRQTSDFLPYMRLALDKYPPSTLQSVSDADLMTYYQRWLPWQHKLHCFSVLRACVAPIVESIILLDRLAYLLEQRDVEEVQLVRLFDPVTSPRCHALIAWKNV